MDPIIKFSVEIEDDDDEVARSNLSVRADANAAATTTAKEMEEVDDGEVGTVLNKVHFIASVSCEPLLLVHFLLKIFSSKFR